MTKRFIYKIYDKNGNYLKTWNDVISEVQFNSTINLGFSELKVRLAREVDSYGEGVDVKYGNWVRLYVFDDESGQDGVCIYSGFIDSYEPIVDGRQETIEVTIVSWWWELNRYLLEGTGTGIDSLIYGNGFSNGLMPIMAGYTSGTITVSASTELSAYNAWKVFDASLTHDPNGVNNHIWATSSGSVTGWLKVDFGAGNSKQIQRYTLVALANDRTQWKNQCPKSWTFEGSNDNANWTVLDTRLNEPDWGEAEKRVYDFENYTAYRYYRLNISANFGSTLVVLAEMDMMEGIAFSREGATQLKYRLQDPSAILKDILDKFTGQGGKLDYSAGTVDLTGTSVQYQFNTATFQEVVQKIVDLCPQDWYMRVGADDLIYLKPKATTAMHKFTIGKNVTYYKQEKRLENIVNYIYFTGFNFYKKFINTGSVSAYGRYVQKIIDDKVPDIGTATTIANNILNKLSSPEIRVTLKVLDSNNAVNESGYDIESIKVGDTCKIFNATKKGYNMWDEVSWDIDAWDYDITNETATLLQIQKIDYFPDYVLLEISNRQPDLAQRIEQINKRLVESLTTDNPVMPQ